MPMFGSSSNDNQFQNRTHRDELGTTSIGAGAGRGFDPTRETYPATGGMDQSSLGERGVDSGAMGRHHAGHRTGRPDDGIMGDAQYTAGSGVGTAIPPAGNFNHGNQTYGADASTTGVVGSQSLKAQGMQKEQEARGLKIQSQELAEAERLEKEAAMRRERAVAHGAHPDNRHVGGMGAGAAGSYD